VAQAVRVAQAARAARLVPMGRVHAGPGRGLALGGHLVVGVEKDATMGVEDVQVGESSGIFGSEPPVRTGAIASVGIRHQEPDLAESLVHCVIETLANEALWIRRQSFAIFCQLILRAGAINPNMILPYLLDMSEDNVPNVRLAVARTLVELDGILDDDCPFLERVSESYEFIFYSPCIDFLS